MPKVSLLMSNYNYAPYLLEALEAIFNQTFNDFELILVDDASTDNSLEVISKYLDKHSNIRFIKHKQNQGFFPSYQKCFELAQGKYIVGLSSDDIILPNFLEENVRILEQHEDIPLSFSRFAYFTDSNPGKFLVTDLQMSYPEMKLSPSEFLTRVKMNRLWIPGLTVCVRKSILNEYGYFDPKYKSASDWFLFHSIAFRHGAYFIPQTLAAQRTHDLSMSKQEPNKTLVDAWAEILNFLKRKENRKLKRAFIRSHIFNSIGIDFFEFVLKRPKYWWFFKQYTYKHFYKRWKAARKCQQNQ